MKDFRIVFLPFVELPGHASGTRSGPGDNACHECRNDDLASSFRTRDNAFSDMLAMPVKSLFNQLNKR
jgi:hypothetical protein